MEQDVARFDDLSVLATVLLHEGAWIRGTTLAARWTHNHILGNTIVLLYIVIDVKV